MKLVNVFWGTAYFANTLAWALGLTVFILSFCLITLHAETLYIPQFQVIVAIMETLGIFVFVAGFVGCLGHVRIHRPSLKGFLILGSIVSLMASVLAVYLPTTTSAFRFVEEMHWSTLENNTIDLVQTKYQCCGYNGPSDFTSSPMRLSCFHRAMNGSILVLTSHDKGCSGQLESVFFVVWMMCLVLIGGGLPVLLLGLVGTVGLENHLRRQKQREDERFVSAQKAMKNVAAKRMRRQGLTPVEKT